MDAKETPSAAEISEAIVIWTGWGESNRPMRDERRLAERFGDGRARELLPTLRRLEEEFYQSDARFLIADLAAMGDEAESRFRELHPELSADAIASLGWCYSYDYK